MAGVRLQVNFIFCGCRMHRGGTVPHMHTVLPRVLPRAAAAVGFARRCLTFYLTLISVVLLSPARAPGLCLCVPVLLRVAAC